jgi:hypothetical protein
MLKFTKSPTFRVYAYFQTRTQAIQPMLRCNESSSVARRHDNCQAARSVTAVPAASPLTSRMAQPELTPAASHRLPPPHAPGGPLRATRAGCRSAPSARMIQAGSLAGIGARRRCSGTSAAGFHSPGDDQCLRYFAVSRLPALAVDLSASRPPTRSLPRRAAASVPSQFCIGRQPVQDGSRVGNSALLDTPTAPWCSTVNH